MLFICLLLMYIDRNNDNEPVFKTFQSNVDTNRYFYPASAVKMPIAFLAIEKLNNLNIEGLDKYTTMLTDSA